MRPKERCRPESGIIHNKGMEPTAGTCELPDIKRTRSAGGVVIGDGGTIALVQAKNNTAWLFPKGHIEEGETDETAARREIREETGLTDLEYIDDLGTYERLRLLADNTPTGDEMKEIHMFLFAAVPHATLAPEATDEIGEAKWFSYRELAEHIGNEKDRVWFATVFERVRQAIQRD